MSGVFQAGRIFRRLSDISLSLRQVSGILAVLLVCCAVAELGSETYRMVTYYPAPYGSYRKFMTTGLTLLASKDGRVGVGYAVEPPMKFDVNGSARIKTQLVLGNNSAEEQDGAVKFDGSDFYFHKGGKWVALASLAGSGTQGATATVLVSGSSAAGSYTPLAKVTGCAVVSGTYKCSVTYNYFYTAPATYCDGDWTYVGTRTDERTLGASCTASAGASGIYVSYSPAGTCQASSEGWGEPRHTVTGTITANPSPPFSANVTVYDMK